MDEYNKLLHEAVSHQLSALSLFMSDASIRFTSTTSEEKTLIIWLLKQVKIASKEVILHLIRRTGSHLQESCKLGIPISARALGDISSD